jgi:hypothetical protein
MAVTQSRSQVNAKASGAEPMQKPNPSSWVPDQSIEDIGGPTQFDYEPTGDSAKIENKGTSQSNTEVNNKGKNAGDVGGGTGGATLKGGNTTLPGGSSSASYDGTNSGRHNEGEKKLPASVAYEHQQIDDTAGESLEELADEREASDDFKVKAKVIFESALNQKLQLEVQRLEEEFASRFEEEITDIAEKVEAFLNYTSAQWLEENKLVVENGIRNELSESFVQGLRSLFEDHYVTLPDEKYDIFESMVAKLDDMEDKLNEQIEHNVALNQSMSSFQRQAVVADVSWDLSEAAKDKLAGLAESVEFESEENYRQKLNILKESFVETEAPASDSGEYLQESADALAPTEMEEMNTSMAAYAAALSRTIK